MRTAHRPRRGLRLARIVMAPLAGVALIALAGLAGCATGTPTGPGADGGDGGDGSSTTTDLTITVDETGEGTDVRSFTLTCDPVGGTHPDAEAACAALESPEVRSAFEPPPADQMCTEQYGGPQQATVTGTLHGEPVDATFSRTNGCEISRWDAVAAVLASNPNA